GIHLSEAVKLSKQVGPPHNETSKTIYRNCATDTSKYFDSGNGPALQQAFQDIAEELINLRVSK
ncbi:MAG: hypothetical protein OXT01_28310, partial [Rhodospirillaceae bacterium]|nr:hypothetical protein [Rhodospirillaceae bacterium]